MNGSDPIRLSDIRESQSAAPAISRLEAERQFKFSFALVIILTLGALAAVAVLPITGWENGYDHSAQVASQTVAVR